MRRIVVTGANKGIGRAIVAAIVREHGDAFVYLGSRDAARGEATRAALVEGDPSWHDRIEVLPVDVADAASVNAAADRVRSGCPGEATPLYAVVNNAGIGLGDANLRRVIEVNARGVQRVADAFVPLVRPNGGRVVNVTSASGPTFVSACSGERQRFFVDPAVTRAQLDAFVEDCLRTPDAAAFAAKGLSDGSPYGLSKACANTLTMVLAHEHPELHINACTPGYIETDLTRPHASARGVSPADMGMKPPEHGTSAPLHLLFGELEGNGRFYGSDAERSPLHEYRAPGSPPYTGG
ncbi:MAG: SDR family NAD(P)-dependent oxidoreductase [Myxococcota bacterium]